LTEAEQLRELARDLRQYLEQLQSQGVRELPYARTETLATIRADLGDCQRCGLCKQRTQIVYGEGPEDAQIAIVGEAPGTEEDASGKPFCGAAGQLLDKMLAGMQADVAKRLVRDMGNGKPTTYPEFSRSRIRIMNTVSCRPPINRKPNNDEILACLPFLERQLTALPNLKCIITLGATPAFALLSAGNVDKWKSYSNGKQLPRLTDLRGKWFEWRGIPLMPTWHPAYLLRDPSHKAETWADLQAVIDRMAK